MTKAAIRVGLADDQALVRHGLRVILERTPDITVAFNADSGQMLLDLLSATQVDVLVLDVRMPHLSGLEVVQRLRRSGNSTPALMLTTFNEPELLRRSIAAGANGFLLKDVEPAEFADAIRLLTSGGTVFVPTALNEIRERVAPESDNGTAITRREVDVLRLVAAGYSNKEIARALAISDGTVRNHMTEIMGKLIARDRTHAVMRAIALRLL